MTNTKKTVSVGDLAHERHTSGGHTLHLFRVVAVDHMLRVRCEWTGAEQWVPSALFRRWQSFETARGGFVSYGGGE